MNLSMSAGQASNSLEADCSGNLVSFPTARLKPVHECLELHPSVHKAVYQFEYQLNQLMLTQSLDPLARLRQVPILLGSLFKVSSCWIIVHDVMQRRVSTAQWHFEDAPQIDQGQDGFETLLHLWKELRRKGPISTADWRSHPELFSPGAQTGLTWLMETALSGRLPSCRSLAAIALPPQATYRASIIVGRSQVQGWQTTDLEFLQTLTRPIGIFLNQMRLQQQQNRHTQQQHFLHHLVQTLSNTSELETVLPLALDGLAQCLGVSQGLILLMRYVQPLLYTPEAGIAKELASRIIDARVEIAYSWSQPHPSDDQALQQSQPAKPQAAIANNASLALARCTILQQAFQQAPRTLKMNGRQMLFCSTRQQGTDWERELRSLRRTLAAGSPISSLFQPKDWPALLMVPITKQETVLGFIVLQHHQRRAWTEEELILAELVAAQLGTAILHRQTLQQVQALVTERTTQLQRSLEVQSKLYEQTRKQIDQLRHLNHLKDEFLSTISHELLTPLTSMRLATQMLRQAELPPERQQKYLNILEEQCNQEIALINDLLALRQLESKSAQLQIQNLDLNSALQTWTQNWSQLWAEKNLTFQIDLPLPCAAGAVKSRGPRSDLRSPSLPLQTDPDSLQRILYELATNASKYSHPERTVHLRISLQQKSLTERQIVIEFSNQGVGIAPEELPHIFDKFRRGRSATAQAVQGTGLGLTLVKHLVRHLQCTITANSYPLAGTDLWETCFTLSLPQYRDSEID